MRTTIIFNIFLLLTGISFGQLPKKAMKKMGTHPVVFLDSIETEMSALRTLNPFDISNVSIIKPKKAKKLIGDKGSDGAIYVTTVNAAKNIYWNFFRTKSVEYAQLLKTSKSDTIVQYILNGQPLSDSAAPGNLFLINDKNFRSLQVMDKEKLLSDNVISKRYVVVITAKRPKGLVKASNSE